MFDFSFITKAAQTVFNPATGFIGGGQKIVSSTFAGALPAATKAAVRTGAIINAYPAQATFKTPNIFSKITLSGPSSIGSNIIKKIGSTGGFKNVYANLTQSARNIADNVFKTTPKDKIQSRFGSFVNKSIDFGFDMLEKQVLKKDGDIAQTGRIYDDFTQDQPTRFDFDRFLPQPPPVVVTGDNSSFNGEPNGNARQAIFNPSSLISILLIGALGYVAFDVLIPAKGRR